MEKFSLAAFAIAMLMVPGAAKSWDGQDQDTGESVTIDAGELVRSGNSIDIYDSSDGSYHNVDVNDITRTGGGVELDIYDNDTGEDRTLEMDDQ